MWHHCGLLLPRLNVLWTVKIVAVFISLGSFMYQTSQSLSLFISSKKIFISSLHDTQKNSFPPVTVYVSYPFDPWRLAKYGFNLSSDDAVALRESLNSLSGVNQTITGKQLVEETMWRLGELVEEVTVGSIKETYTTLTTSSDLWTVSYSMFGPSYTLIPPPVTNVSDKLTVRLRTLQRLETCSKVPYDGQIGCEALEKYCSTTCVIEDIKETIFSILALEMTTEGSYATYIMPLNYKVQYPNLELEQYEVLLASNPPLSYSPEDCIAKCLSALTETKENCKILNAVNINETLSKLCSYEALYETNKELQCRNICPPAQQSKYWRVRKKYFHSSELTLTLISDKVTKIQEVETFPVNRLLSDIGGNLGLFLGVSLFSLWMDVSVFLEKWWKKFNLYCKTYYILTKSFRDHLVHVLQYCLICCLLLALMVHLSVTLQSYIQQEKQEVVTLTSNEYTVLTSQTFSDNVSMQDWINGFLASRAFGCRVEPPTEHGRCLQQCFLHEKASQQSSLLPYLLTDDLAPCSYDDLPVLVSYVIPGDLEHAISEQTKYRCKSQCKADKHVAGKPKALYPIPKTNYLEPISGTQLLCIMGGIIGLYFGLCFLDIPEAFIKRTQLIKNNDTVYFFIRMLCMCIASIVGGTICMQQVVLYVFSHPVLTSASISPLAVPDLPTLSICPWPPVNFGMLSEDQVNHTDVINMLPHVREQYVYQLMHKTLKAGKNMTYLWNKMWTLGGTFQCSEFGSQIYTTMNRNRHNKMTATPLGQCYTCSPNVTADELKNKDPYYCMRAKNTGTFSFLMQVHDSAINPFLGMWENGADIVSDITVYLKSLSKFTSFGSSGDIKHSTCMSDCIHMLLSKEYDCKVPVYKSHVEIHNINITGCSLLLAHVLQGTNSPDDLFSWLNGEGRDQCNKSCKTASFRSYDIEILQNQILHRLSKRKSGIQYMVRNGASVEVCFRVSTVTTEHREEFSGYTLTQFLSDMGGVGGFTLGVSLLTLLLKIPPQLQKLGT